MPATPTLHAQKPKSELDWHSFRKQAQGNGKIRFTDLAGSVQGWSRLP